MSVLCPHERQRERGREEWHEGYCPLTRLVWVVVVSIRTKEHQAIIHLVIVWPRTLEREREGERRYEE